MANAILVLNAGSSSIKFSVFLEHHGELAPGTRGQVERIPDAPRFVARAPDGTLVEEQEWEEGDRLDHGGALDHLLDFLHRELADDHLMAAGHRIVHGGQVFDRPVQVDERTLEVLDALVPLAPLHQPHGVAAIRLLHSRAPGLPQVACFDTAFHRSMPELAARFALPEPLYEAGVRRYGFHGLSYEYVASRLPALDPAAARGRTITLHLGNGASMCAMHGSRSIATTMAFTALDGLVMGTRCGALDPGVVLYLVGQSGMDVGDVERLLYERSGLLGVSGLSSDMRVLLASNDPSARLAVDLYVYRIGLELGSLAAALGGLDAIVFTAGIGENSAAIRERVCRDARWLGVVLDPRANAEGGPRISTRRSRVSAWVVPTNEELVIARHAYRVVHSALEEGTVPSWPGM
jgi:acetate kinase